MAELPATSPPLPVDEGRHPPDHEELWNESWYLDFTTDDGRLGGYVRLGLYPNLEASWLWACVVGEGRPLVTVLDHEAPLPTAPGLELRTEGLWCDLTCETPLEHWSVGLEAFGVALDEPTEVYRSCRGDRTPLGLDLEWETEGGTYAYPGVTRYEVPCRVHGEVLVGSERIGFEGWGERDHSWGRRDWWSFEWCWTAGRLDDGTAWHASRPLVAGVRYEPGFVAPPGGGPAQIDRFEVADESGREGLPAASRLQVGDLSLAVEPRSFAPVRLDAPDGRVSHLARALSRFTAPDGRTGWGWMEWNQPQSREPPPLSRGG
jgi:hypothetical protein